MKRFSRESSKPAENSKPNIKEMLGEVAKIYNDPTPIEDAELVAPPDPLPEGTVWPEDVEPIEIELECIDLTSPTPTKEEVEQMEQIEAVHEKLKKVEEELIQSLKSQRTEVLASVDSLRSKVARVDSVDAALEGFRNYARRQTEQQDQTVRTISALREDLDKERAKVKNLELGMEKVVQHLKTIQTGATHTSY